MIRALSVERVRAVESAAMAALPEGELMQRAARGLAAVAAARLDERDGRTVVALIGSGDNGGDALYAAGLLAAEGFPCAAVLVSDRGRAGAHAAGLAAAESAGVAVTTVADGLEAAAEVVSGADLVLDGIAGIGGSPGLRPAAATLVEAVDEDAWVIAVDVASGLDPEGRVGGEHAVWADETVTFSTPKPVHLLPAGEAATGRLTVVDIGLDVQDETAAVERLTFDDAAALWPVPGFADDKYSRGVLGVVAGGEHYTGAAILSVTAAVEAGAGMVRYVGPPTPTQLVRAAVPEAVHGEGRVQAWLLGSGLDVQSADEDQLRVARAALASDLPVVVDAGGLDLLEGPRAAPTLLTPHAGEAARLLTRLLAAPDGTTNRNESDAADTVSTDGSVVDAVGPAVRPLGEASGEVTRGAVEADPVGAARRLAELTGATVLLKGSTTLVAGPTGPVRSQADAPAWLATAGTGDVLAGLLGTLLAAGLSPFDAGSVGALVHGVAGGRASAGGPLRALKVAHAIPEAVRELLTRGA
jgi:ADP-dependent NAD(P)H-hydrate dehydratase / NAD(P)H-hydrate epimerase